MNNLVVVDDVAVRDELKSHSKNYQVLHAEDYLNGDQSALRNVRVFNLCSDYSYCKKGYYVSLLAEARKHRPFPNTSTVIDFQNKDFLKLLSTQLSDSLKKNLSGIKKDRFELSIYFGKNMAEKYVKISWQIFNSVQAPLLRAYFYKKNDEWRVSSIQPIPFNKVPKSHIGFVKDCIDQYFNSGHSLSSKKKRVEKYDLAILINPDEKLPPSDEKAIKAFTSAALDLRIYPEIITSSDYALISRFDALFIRETTSLLDHTYKFAKRAETEGLVVIDDPTSIIRCCNKVFLHDYLQKKKLPTPGTCILSRERPQLPAGFNFPLVVKKPDSAFSAGVKKVQNQDELDRILAEFFETSDLVILQEFLTTDFDWRVGLIDGEPLYVCKYFMAKDHWQIIHQDHSGLREGDVESFVLSEAPRAVIRLAQKACEAIGNSLYGVDIKERDGKFYVIEINDNPSIEKGYEDRVAGEALYHRIMSSFLRRLEIR